MVSVPSSGDYQFLLKGLFKTLSSTRFPSPHPGIINFFTFGIHIEPKEFKFPSPHPGIINFFHIIGTKLQDARSFRPLIRGLSISSELFRRSILDRSRFRPLIRGLSISSKKCKVIHTDPRLGFRPLIRGLSISSPHCRAGAEVSPVSVPSSGDYQFLPNSNFPVPK